MSILRFLGLSEKPAASAETDAIRKVVDALDHLEESQARYIAAFGYILGRVAHADLKISPEETAAMERLVAEHAGLPESQAVIVTQMAKTRAQLFGGTENFLVTREFDRIASREQKMALLDCLYAVAAAEGQHFDHRRQRDPPGGQRDSRGASGRDRDPVAMAGPARGVAESFRGGDVMEPGRSSIDDIIDVYKKDVDVTLLDEMLKLTPEQRIRRMEEFGRFIEELRQGR